jgi:hypothetical protein
VGVLRFFTVLLAMVLPAWSHGATTDDAYIAGYAAGALKHNLKLDMPALKVRDGVITFPAGGLSSADQKIAVQLLSEIPGVNGIKIAETVNQTFTEPSQSVRVDSVGTHVTPESDILPAGLLPEGHLFKTLLADPRWPRFSAAYRNYQSDNFDGNDIASVSFGETIPFYRSFFGRSIAQWEAGLQAGVFSDFNLGAASSDLVNSDFIAALYSSVRIDDFSAFGRFYHQSSHLGDEFLLRKINTGFERINLSYEGIDLKLSYEFPYGIRLYGGGSALFHKEPSALKTLSAQYGLEFRSPWHIGSWPISPVAAVDIKNYEQNRWSTDVSARAGLEFDNRQILGRKLLILAEYFNGYSPTGQFYRDKVEYIGVGAHYLF